MRNRIALFFVWAIFAFIALPQFSFSQNTPQGIDAVAISKNYYNSTVKILLYDSAYAKIDPKAAYLGRGSGFFVSEDGYIFTNRHVIQWATGYCRYTTYNPETKSEDLNLDNYSPSILSDASIDKITYVGRAAVIVQVYDNDQGSSYKLYCAKIIAIDTANFDGAIIKIVSTLDGQPVNVKFHPVPLGNSDSISQGQDLCLYGFPAQYNGTYEQMLGDLSTLIFGKHSGYDYSNHTFYGLIKTDAAINNGNSGGPVFGPGNRVVGLATAAFEKTNVGLIGAINNMYDLAALIPDLHTTLVPPARKPPTLSVGMYKLKALATKKMLRRANYSSAKAGVVNNPWLVDLMSVTAVSSKITGQLQTLQSGSGLYGKSGTFNLNSPYPGPGIDLRIARPYIVKQKNNLIGLFLNLSVSTLIPDWSPLSSSIYFHNTSVTPTVNQYATLNTNPSLYGSVALGLSYSYLFTYKTSVTVYYSYGLFIDLINNNKIGNVNDSVPMQGGGNGYNTTTNQVTYNISQKSATSQAIGLFFRIKHLVIGAEYRMSAPEVITFDGDQTGNNNNNNGFNSNINFGGPQATLANRSSINVFIGVSIRPKHKQD